jgi:hemerythrin
MNMNKLEWSPDMSLGIPVIDKAHQQFLLKLSAIEDASDREFRPQFLALVQELEQDFIEEEEVMEAIRFYEILPHREQHARVLAALHKVTPDVLCGHYDAARKTLGLLPKWFLFHLTTGAALLSMWYKLKNTDMTLESSYGDQHHVASQHIRSINSHKAGKSHSTSAMR